MKSRNICSLGALLVLAGACSSQSGDAQSEGARIGASGVTTQGPASVSGVTVGAQTEGGAPNSGAPNSEVQGGQEVTAPTTGTPGQESTTTMDPAAGSDPDNQVENTGQAAEAPVPAVPEVPVPAMPEPALPALPEPALPEPAMPEPAMPEPAMPEPPALPATELAALDPNAPPSDNFDLSQWKLTLPDIDQTDGNALEIGTRRLLEGFENDTWYFTDKATGALVFRAPNQAATTENTSNVRSELRQMLNPGGDPREPDNNWVLSTHPNPAPFAAIGGRLKATLAVDHVSLSGNDEKFVAGAVVVGQIHGEGKTEPLKIFYRKLPNHSHGSIFWNYEVRPLDENERYDVTFDVWGDHQLSQADANPAQGVPLGSWFSYEVDIVGKLMKLEFRRWDGAVKSFELNIADGHPEHPIDRGYSDDWFYFRAGAYNQCNTASEHPIWGAECSNNGIEAGDYAEVRFFAVALTQE